MTDYSDKYEGKIRETLYINVREKNNDIKLERTLDIKLNELEFSLSIFNRDRKEIKIVKMVGNKDYDALCSLDNKCKTESANMCIQCGIPISSSNVYLLDSYYPYEKGTIVRLRDGEFFNFTDVETFRNWMLFKVNAEF